MIDQLCLSESLLEGAKEVFETMVFMDIVESTDPYRFVEGDTLLGSITFTGNLEGCLSICCDISCAKAITINMLGMEPDDPVGNEDICDSIGEISNMVMGSVKSRIAESVGTIEVSIPSVVSGHELESTLCDKKTKIIAKVNIQDEYYAEFTLLYREN